MSVTGKRGRRGALHREKKTMQGVMADINVTPLIDVVLVLLVVFMVITRCSSRG